MNRRNFLRGALASTAVAAAGGASLLSGFDTDSPEFKTVRHAIGLNTPLRLVVLGDIHFDPLYDEVYLARILNSIDALQPDMILYTGDFITKDVTRIPDLTWLLAQVSARLGIFSILGNHDSWCHPELITASLQSRGIRVLRNESVALPGEDAIFLTGLESFWAGEPSTTSLSRTSPHARHVVLVHEPDSFALLTDPRIKVQICGHTHGGQIRMPLLGALCLPAWGKRYDEGAFRQDGRFLYVNRGVGTLFPHVRYNCRPEITVLELS